MSVVTLSSIDCRLDPVEDIAHVEQLWRTLQDRCKCSYFLSWSWIGAWLRQLPLQIQPMVFVAREAGVVVGLAIMIGKHLRRHGIINSHALFVNKTGDHDLDEITIEYNGFLAEPHKRDRVTIAALHFLTSNGWDEVFIDATVISEAFCSLLQPSWRISHRSASRAYGVDLRALNSTGKNYLNALGSNTRYQVRRALREYAKLGPLCIEAAQTLEAAIEWLTELRRLHQVYWTGKGLPGAFSNQFLANFHENLVADRMEHGEIQLLRIRFGERCIGYLYGFYWEGAVLNYQSGLDYDVLPDRNHPGLVSHYAAIEFNRTQGADYYDFLGGDSQHKKSLSTTIVPMDWIVTRRVCFKFWFEDMMRVARNRMFPPNSPLPVEK